ncbi:MAG: ATP-binding cassette domain-containing protein, partial [Desulfotomaculaceae bacterium]
MLELRLTKKLWHFTMELELEVGNQILVLWGHSGAGKTTVLHCLAGLRKPSSGQITLNRRVLYSSKERINIPTRSR